MVTFVRVVLRRKCDGSGVGYGGRKETRLASVLAVALAAFGCGHGVPSVLPACQKTGIVKQSLPSKNFYAAHPELAAVCRLGVTRHRFLHLGSKTYFSTGAIVEGRYLVTAAHNIATLPGRQLKSIAITCGASVVRLQNPPQIFAEGKALRAAVHNPDKYWWKDYPRDYAVLDLEQGDLRLVVSNIKNSMWVKRVEEQVLSDMIASDHSRENGNEA